MNELKITVTVSHEFSKEDINDLISTALEGGINYWCRKAIGKKDAEGFLYEGVDVEDRDNIKLISDLVSMVAHSYCLMQRAMTGGNSTLRT
jgi:predicted aldo/keto reductase-like oxidoreductase